MAGFGEICRQRPLQSSSVNEKNTRRLSDHTGGFQRFRQRQFCHVALCTVNVPREIYAHTERPCTPSSAKNSNSIRGTMKLGHKLRRRAFAKHGKAGLGASLHVRVERSSNSQARNLARPPQHCMQKRSRTSCFSPRRRLPPAFHMRRLHFLAVNRSAAQSQERDFRFGC
jgi:hypothetical protein